MMKRSGMPKKIEILNYWANIILHEYPDKFHMDIAYLDMYATEDGERLFKSKKEYHLCLTSVCFACGSTTYTERAHILPLCEGGNNSIKNLHILCDCCHKESEYISGNFYWQWFKSKNLSNSGSYLRQMTAAKTMSDAIKKHGFESIEKLHPSRFINTLLILA